MNNLVKNKALLGFVGLLIVVLVAGGFFLVLNKKTNTTNEPGEEEQILSLSPEEIGLSLEMGDDGNRVIMRVDKVEGITSLEYQLSYTSEGDIPRGAIGDVEVTGEPIEKEIVLGTCSDTCHYDEGVTDIKIILKVTKEDGKIYQVEKALEE